MKSTIVKIIDTICIHARPTSKITNETTKYKSEIKFIVNGKVTNAKSLINLMALGVKVNNNVEIQTIGSDKDQAFSVIMQVVNETNFFCNIVPKKIVSSLKKSEFFETLL